jgi:hypothetical protein
MIKQKLIRNLLFFFLALFFSINLYASDKYIPVTEKNKVCMVNDFYNPMADFSNFMVKVENKNYYGCCSMCKEKLMKSSQFRIGIDPLTNEKISKADAYIVADKTNNGKTIYFKNKSNFLNWSKQKAL